MRRIEMMMNVAPLFRRATRLIVAPLFRRATYKRLSRSLIQENELSLVIDWDCNTAWDTPRGGCGPEGHSTVDDQKIDCRSLIQESDYERLYHSLIQEGDLRLIIDWDYNNAWDTPRGGCGPEGHSTVDDQKIDCRSLIQEGDLLEAYSHPYSGV